MAATYDTSLADDVSLVRFHIGDTNTDAPFLQDETIQYWITKYTTIGRAVVYCLTFIISQLSQPDFTLDWLSVSNDNARKAYEVLLKKKAQEFNISLSGAVLGASVGSPVRADSLQTVADSDYDGSSAV